MSRVASHKACILIVVAITFLAQAVQAQGVGPVTNLPMPRFVSMKASEANIRRGPSLTHRVDWVFRHQGMPLVVTGEYGHWRRVVDRDGMGGWIHYALLSGTRTAIIVDGSVDMQSRPMEGAPVSARAEQGVIAKLGECANGWCKISAGGKRGWVPRTALWGVELTD